VSVLKCSWTASNRRWIRPPSLIITTGRKIIGRSATSVRRTLMCSMKPSAKAPPKIVLVRYMIAGPAA